MATARGLSGGLLDQLDAALGYAQEHQGRSDEWFEYRLLNDPHFLKRIEKARKEIREGKGIPLEALKEKAEHEAQADACKGTCRGT